MMTICVIIYAVSTGFYSFDIKEEMVIANSEAGCYNYANKKWAGKVSVSYPGHSATPQSLCGPELKDCKDLR